MLLAWYVPANGRLRDLQSTACVVRLERFPSRRRMNFLAHLHVGRHLQPVERAGNLFADYCKVLGNERFRRGVHFHRRIDAFTDSHAVAGEARALFNTSYRHFGGVLSDLAFNKGE